MKTEKSELFGFWAMVGLVTFLLDPRALSCAAASRSFKHAVNADQTVIILWDAEAKKQHFIRQASFLTDDTDVGFVVPSPSRPELEESGDAAFDQLLQLTAQEVKGGGGFSLPIGCRAAPQSAGSAVTVLERKRVAGFDAVVLKAGSGDALVTWLEENGYANSPAMAAWAKPYVEKGWPFTALKVAEDESGAADRRIAASALRISFRTDTPLFPYREPDSREAAEELGAAKRLLRIYFIADAAYDGVFANGDKWPTARRVWSGDITSWKGTLLSVLKLPENSGPKRWWLTEIEDKWPYEIAPADIHFVKSGNQKKMKRPVIRAGGGGDLLAIVLAGGLVFWVIRKFVRPVSG